MDQQRGIEINKERADRQQHGQQDPDKPFFQTKFIGNEAKKGLHQQRNEGVDGVQQTGFGGADAEMLSRPDDKERHGG